MNQYGRRAQRYWQANLPHQYSQIEDPQTFFDRMGQAMATQIDALSDDLAGPDRPQESFLDKVGRLNRARDEAEMQVMRETLPAPESSPVEDETIEDQDSSV